ncbi:hypothetical protein ACFTQ7_21030 [Lysinibacillus sp. NPDC056959]|uniref:hypothetical protein n=1 Tax=Lysinibacillus sp. NPDC056959 TaxID=3345981 RepID=UPI00364347B4
MTENSGDYFPLSLYTILYKIYATSGLMPSCPLTLSFSPIDVPLFVIITIVSSVDDTFLLKNKKFDKFPIKRANHQKLWAAFILKLIEVGTR